MTKKSKCDRGDQIELSADDRRIMQDMAALVQTHLTKLDSYNRAFSNARQVVLSVSGGNLGDSPNVTLQVYGKAKPGSPFAKGNVVCYRDPPGVCEPGPCDYLSN